MSPTEGNSDLHAQRRLMLGLPAAHLVVGLVLGGVTRFGDFAPRPSYVLAAFVGLAFAQACLLGTWCALSRSSLWIRMTGGIAVVAYLGPMFAYFIREWTFENVTMVATTPGIVTGVLLVARCCGVEPTRKSDTGAETRWPQFSIRQLLVLTLLMACLVSIGKWLLPRLDFFISPWLVLVIVLAFAFVGLTGVWTMLGVKHWLLGVLSLAGVALAGAWGLTAILPHGFPFWATVMMAQAGTLAGTLGVVRHHGFRLRRRARKSGTAERTCR
jgi:hypothetical protein